MKSPVLLDLIVYQVYVPTTTKITVISELSLYQVAIHTFTEPIVIKFIPSTNSVEHLLI